MQNRGVLLALVKAVDLEPGRTGRNPEHAQHAQHAEPGMKESNHRTSDYWGTRVSGSGWGAGLDWIKLD